MEIGNWNANFVYRQHRLAVEVERQQQEQAAAQGHIDHIMKSGFTMNDIKGLHRYGEENVDIDEGMVNPSKPSRKGSVSRGSPTYDIMSMERSGSALDIDFQMDEDKSEKKRGRSPFNFFKKSQSKEKHKSKSPPDRNRGRGTCKILSFRDFNFNFNLLFK